MENENKKKKTRYIFTYMGKWGVFVNVDLYLYAFGNCVWELELIYEFGLRR